MNASICTGRVDPRELDTTVDAFRAMALPALTHSPGSVDAQAWVNRESGEFVGLAMFGSEEARAAAEPLVGEILGGSSAAAGGTSAQQRSYELAASTALEARAVAERAIQAINDGELERLARDLAPDVVCVAQRGMEYRGPQATKERLQSWRSAFPDGRLEPVDIVASGSTVVVEGEYTGTHLGTWMTQMGSIPATGRRVASSFVQVYVIDRGLISRLRVHVDRMSIMAQLGVVPARIGTSA